MPAFKPSAIKVNIGFPNGNRHEIVTILFYSKRIV